MRRAACPGSFDPVTNGHLDIIGRASLIFDRVTVTIGVNPAKQARFFDIGERLQMLGEATAHLSNVDIATFEGLLVDYCKAEGIPVIVKGLRAVSDFDYELQMAQMNHSLAGIETVFMPTSPEYSFLSSSLVKEVAAFGADVSRLVPPTVLQRLSGRARD